jgi:hypothetical protein
VDWQRVKGLRDYYFRVIGHFHALGKPDLSVLNLDHQFDGGVLLRDAGLVVATPPKREQLVSDHLHLLFLLF